MLLEKRNIIIIGSIIGIIIIGLAIVGLTMQKNPEGQNETSYVDPGSGETIIDSDKSPQGTDLSLKNAIIYPGFSKLIDRGLSPAQVQSIQSVISEYSLKQSEPFKEVSLTVDSVRHILPQGESTTHMMTFELTVDRKTPYFVEAEYENMSSINTKLYSSDRKTLLIEG